MKAVRWTLATALLLAGCGAGHVGDGGADHSVPSDMVSDGGTTPDLVAPDLLPACTSSATCPSDKPICDTGAGVCRTCVVDTEDSKCAAKSASTPYCSATGTCVECKQSGQCSTAKPICSTAGACVACGSSADDAICMARDTTKAHCEFTGGVNLGQCVECAQSSQCPTAKPVCELATTDATRNQCRGCVAHSECGADKLCNKGDIDAATKGQCVTPVIVDKNAAGGCKSSGAEAKPWCELQQALDNEPTPGSGPLYLLVKGPVTVGSEYLRAAITDSSTNKNVVIVGTGGATVLEDKQIGFRVSLSTGAANVVLESLTFGQAMGTGANNLKNAGIQCVGTGATVKLTVRSSTVQQVLTGPGITSTDCNLVVDAVTAAGNQGAGLQTSGATLVVDASTFVGNQGAGAAINSPTEYRVQNSLFAKNTVSGVAFDGTSPSSSSRFWFNTLVGNGAASTKGGLNCGALSSGTRPIAASIVAFNAKTTGATGTQLNGDCEFTDVVAGVDEGATTTGLIKQDPALVNAASTATEPAALRSAYSLSASDTVCKDKIDVAAGQPAADLFGTRRPQGTKLDIGAHELVQ